MLTQDLHIQIAGDGVVDRRSFLRRTAAGAAGVMALSWMDVVRLEAAEMRKRGMSCILLFMQGGPSQFETFDPKPGTETGGPTQAIKTKVPGIQIAHPWPRTAEVMDEIALIRSMTAREGNHQRAQYQLHTGYLPSGAIKYPSLGALVAKELGDPQFDLPHFVSIGTGALNSSGFLGAKFAPFVVQDPTELPANAELPDGVSADRLKRRLDLLKRLERGFAESGGKLLVDDHRALYDTAAQMVRSPHLKAFDLSEEREELRDAYGLGPAKSKSANGSRWAPFGQGCLLARRLVQAGVTFVEVLCNNSGEPINWDTHRNNFGGHDTLAGFADPGFATLIRDLKDKRMLEKTLVIWMGEFGRTPLINAKTGRDHYPQAFSVALAGGGIRGGRVVGATDATGREVVDRPVTIPDLFCTFYEALGINPRKENATGVGRSVKLVEGGAPVKELFA
jgi:hypothetical protein